MMIIPIAVFYFIGSLLMFNTLFQVNEDTPNDFAKSMTIHILSLIWPVTMLLAGVIVLISFLRSFNAPK